MMKLLIISDTHWNYRYLKIVLQCVNVNFGSVDHIIHCGDGINDLDDIGYFGSRSDVKGNCDIGYSDTELFEEIDDTLLFITHGHTYNVKTSLDELKDFVQAESCIDLAIFGHTHIPAIYKDDKTIYLNPGSVGAPKVCKPTFAIAEIDNGIKSLTIYECFSETVCESIQSLETAKEL